MNFLAWRIQNYVDENVIMLHVGNNFLHASKKTVWKYTMFEKAQVF